MTPTPVPSKGMLGLFTRHPVAANLLMIILIIAGLFALSRLNTQFFPDFALDRISVRVTWSGATAEDVEDAVTRPLEQSLRNVDSVKNMTSTSADSVSSITLEFEEKTDLSLALEQVKQEVDQVSNLPAAAEVPEVARLTRYEAVAKVLVSGPQSRDELRKLAQQFERELLDRGISKVSINGLPEEEIAIEVPASQIRQLGLSIADIGRRVQSVSQDVPVGTAGRDDTARQLRFLDQRRSAMAFEDLPLVANENGQLVTVGDVATVSRRDRTSQVTISYRGKPAVELNLQRSTKTDTLKSAKILNTWLEEKRATLPPTITLHTYDERWQPLRQRINVLLKNGLGGLILVVAILYLFLSARVALWVTVGIPVSFLAALAVLWAIGGSINMLSLFALIMALGIIVDDAIVVGEDAMARFQRGLPPVSAAEGAGWQMLGPVMSSSLTTIGAFLPLLIVGGIVGSILRTIPVVVICVIVASLIECFLILPGHLRHAFEKTGDWKPGGMRKRFDDGFQRFRDGPFRKLVTVSVEYRFVTLVTCLGLLLVSFGLVAGRHIGFQFFPSPEATTLFANVSFIAGTPKDDVLRYVQSMEDALYATEAELGEPIVVTAAVKHGTNSGSDNGPKTRGDQVASIALQLVESDERTTRNPEIITRWQERLAKTPGIESLSITAAAVGPPGRDVEVRISGTQVDNVKNAALELRRELEAREGVIAIDDDMPFGREQMVMALSPVGESLGLSVENVGSQLRAAFDGYLVQVFPDGEDELEVRVLLPDHERNRLAAVDAIDIVLPDGGTAPLSNLVNITSRRGFEAIRHSDGILAATVQANVLRQFVTEDEIRAEINNDVMPDIAKRHGVSFSLEGRAADQRETLTDMRTGALIAMAMIYLVLAWVFGSYGWPLVVMAIIPFGLVGAIWGHWLTGIDITLLSLFGFFGLAGIVVNDSIILVVFYKQLRQKGLAVVDAVIEASCQRLRAVLLTSLTTIAGLLPLLFETSLQAQFLIPMATSIAFGLAFATVLVLLLIPSLLLMHENFVHKLGIGRPPELATSQG